uniref:Uncharacterized protein n=1 Tax=Photinus pyralis TaxID=7054 RepID=A0A1Y1LPL6_PHOPY
MFLQKLLNLKNPPSKLSFCTFAYLRRNNEELAAHVFDQNAKRLQRERAVSASDVKLYDYLKSEIGYRLSDRIFDIKRKFTLAADLGTSRGYVAKHVSPSSVEELILCDSNAQHLKDIEVQDGIKIRKQIINEERIEVSRPTVLRNYYQFNALV